MDMVPPVDVIEDKDGYRFYFEMPGLTNELIDPCVENGRLVVVAERKRPAWPAETEVPVTEREYGTIRRAFELPDDASHDTIKASYKDGVLEVTVKSEDPRQLKISAAARAQVSASAQRRISAVFVGASVEGRF
jgi:HSP20 family protein